MSRPSERYAGRRTVGDDREAGRLLQARRTVVDLLDRPRHEGGTRQRQILLHAGFVVLEEVEGPDFGTGSERRWLFGYAERDGYLGWAAGSDLAEPADAFTHVVAAPRTYLYGRPELKAGDEPLYVSHGTRLAAGPTFEDGRWTEVSRLREDEHECKTTSTFYVPIAHLRPLDAPESDPAAVAERLIGTPYLWGGNSGFGIDCSGMVQAALHACGIDCPGDSDLQEAIGQDIPPDAPLRRGDLVFWRGHVAMMRDAETMVHANARAMAVSVEGFAEACARIEAQGDGGVTARRRVAG
ncbi:C40 family peptidase [Wenxinia marina]|uniref:Cell wall-associated hydrolase (Invasion-associated protein) n=1 Tax=Wenxinia marina DSM 24838 TaxID=1123501 RepID=A0A0D0Q6C5_9RHOB|nr:NlpC/P60 family protein [Wenxinia marina]KIQ70019.1 Cell wall-associated hydrolase (invasion-associated protein) [Wenxinia marina DSM 24838]GGL62896.1 hypothetical protein GCM10011392_16940 [Wenxinia marina]